LFKITEMQQTEPEEEYQKLQKKYSLPSLKELANNFGVPSSSGAILNDVMESMLEKIAENAKMLESMVFVNNSASISDMYENQMLNDEEKLFEFYKGLMSMHWEGRKVKINGKEEEMAEFIKKANKKWEKDVKPVLLKLCDSLNKGWKEAELHNSESDSNMTYHG